MQNNFKVGLQNSARLETEMGIPLKLYFLIMKEVDTGELNNKMCLF